MSPVILHDRSHSKLTLTFLLSFYIIKPSIYYQANCGSQPYALTATTEWQEITSPNYPSDYGNSHWCNTLITPNLRFVVMEPLHFNTQDRFDQLYIFEENYDRFWMKTGDDWSTNVVTDGPAWVIFRTSSRTTRDGYRIRYKASK